MDAWILTANEDCTKFFATSEYYNVSFSANSWQELYEKIDFCIASV